MRIFEGTLFGNQFQWTMKLLLLRCKEMIIAINSLHNEGIVRVILKEYNIFGFWATSDHVRTMRPYSIDNRRLLLIGKLAHWHNDWFAMALVIGNQLRVHEAPVDCELRAFRN